MLEAKTAEVILCPSCGTEVAAHFLICPGCHRLVHGGLLKSLADQATAAEASEDWASAMSSWRSALELLPTSSRQHQSISQKIAVLGKRVDALPRTPKSKADPSGSNMGWSGGASVAGLGSIGLMIWKIKTVLFVIATKGKLLLLGLTKVSTLLSMFVTLSAYWSLWGWPFAVSLIVVTYIHEMGHVAALLRYGIDADAPMFVPGFGAYVRAKQRLSNVRELAQFGLGGPIWGVATVAACYGLYFATGYAMFAGVARLAAILNLFQLIPFWILDGTFAFRAFSRPHRWLVAAVSSAMLAMTSETDEVAFAVLILIVICSAYRAAFEAPSKEPDVLSLVEYLGLVVALSLAIQIPTPLP